MAVDYRSKIKCQVNGCGWKHHTMLHVKKKRKKYDSTPPNHPAVTSEDTGMSTISGAVVTGTSAVSWARNSGQFGAAGYGKKNVCLRIVTQSTVRKKMATGTFTYNALRTKTLKERIKTQENCKSFKLDKSNAVSAGTTAIKPYLSICLVGLVWFARYCGKMYRRHFFSYGGL